MKRKSLLVAAVGLFAFETGATARWISDRADGGVDVARPPDGLWEKGFEGPGLQWIGIPVACRASSPGGVAAFMPEGK